MGGGEFNVFEVPYITAKMISTHCSQFHNFIPYTDKKSFTFNTHVATFFSQNHVYFLLFLQELSYVRHFSRPPIWLVCKSITPVNIQLSRRKFNNYSDTVCHYTNLFHWWKSAPKKSIFTLLQSTTLQRIILRSFYSPFAITTSGFYFQNCKGIWLDENASCHSENANFIRRF